MTAAYLNGERPQENWTLVLALIWLGYPFILFLLWLQHRLAIRNAIKDVREAIIVPDKLRRRRKRWRCASLVFLIGAGVGCVYMGHSGFLIDNLPAQYLGYFMLALAFLGICGLNIRYGGPFDRRFDPEMSASDPPKSPRE